MSSPVTWRPLKDLHFTSCFYLFFLCVYRGIRRGAFTSRNGCFVMYTGQTTQPACWSNILTVILGHMKFNNTMYKLDIHCTDLCQRPMCNINVNKVVVSCCQALTVFTSQRFHRVANPFAILGDAWACVVRRRAVGRDYDTRYTHRL